MGHENKKQKTKLRKLMKQTNYLASSFPLSKYKIFKENKILKGKKDLREIQGKLVLIL